MTIHDDRAPVELTALLTERAAGIDAPADLLLVVRSRASRARRNRWWAVGVAALAATAAGVVTVSASSTPARGTARVTAGANAGIAVLTGATAPSFPLTPTDLPTGLAAARTAMTHGTTRLEYAPVDAPTAAAVLTVEVTSTSNELALVGPSTSANVGGAPASLFVTGPGTEALVFTRTQGEVVTVAGVGAFSSPQALTQVAESLTARPVAATLPFDIPVLPTGLGPVTDYDVAAQTERWGPATGDPTLTIAFTSGAEVSAVGPGPDGASPTVVTAEDHRYDGTLRVTSGLLPHDQLVALAAQIRVVAAPGTVVETTLSAAPVETAPPSLPSPGPQPADPTAAADAVKAAFHTAFTAEPPGDPYASLARVEGGARLHATLDQVRANFPQAVSTITVATGPVVFTSPTTATVLFTLSYTGGAAYGTTDGTAVRAGGTWLVSRATYCAVMAFGGASCPGQ